MFIRTTMLFSLVLLSSAYECRKNEDCDMTGSVCSKNVCICTSGTTANSLYTKCVPVSNGFGSLCEDNVQCSVGLKSGGICNNSTCSCSEGYHYFLGQCWKSSGLGESCKRHEHCFVNYDFEAAVCSDKKVCACAPGYYQREYSSCRRASFSPGDPCGIYLDCKFDDALCNMNRTCEIRNATKNISKNDQYNLINEEPITISLSSKVDDSCSSNRDCPTNSLCNEEKKCRCLQGFYTLDNSSCHPELGAQCQDDSQCIGKYTQCRNGTICVCKQGYVSSYDGRHCDKMSRDIGWSCLRDEQCGFFGPHGLCIHKKCHCDDKSHYVDKQMFCWILKKIGESCNQNEDCGTSERISCVNGKCACAQNTHPSSNNTECHQDSNNVGESCVEDLDCTFNNSFCDTKKTQCTCRKGYFDVNGTCSVGVGGKCKNTNVCKAEGTNCTNGECQCSEGSTSSTDFSQCLPILSYLNESCSQDSQCSKLEGKCTNGYCSCLNGSHFIDGFQCFISKKINQTCTSRGNCSYIPHSYCYQGRCQCLPGYHSIGNGTWCSGASIIFKHSHFVAVVITCFFMKYILNWFHKL